jgi:hypothetical protein
MDKEQEWGLASGSASPVRPGNCMYFRHSLKAVHMIAGKPRFCDKIRQSRQNPLHSPTTLSDYKFQVSHN